jgi:nucleoside-diphosphate-sugar epimerase
MRILVTGATGFIGSRLLERLTEQDGHDLYSLQRYVTGRYVLGADHRVKTVFCDLRDNFAVRCAIREVQPEVVFHLAALSPVSYSYDHPNEVIDTNLNGTRGVVFARSSVLQTIFVCVHFRNLRQ